jgi:hypothetical protein
MGFEIVYRLQRGNGAMIIALMVMILLMIIAPESVLALFLLAFVGGMPLLDAAQAHAMEFAGTCHGAGAVVTSFDDFGTDQGSYTRYDGGQSQLDRPLSLSKY